MSTHSATLLAVTLPTPTVVAPGRARPLPADERRALIVAAALPLLRRHGAAVTTREIAEAAGIAEGTIFRVFPEKQALIDAAVAAALDPGAALADLDRVDLAAPLERRLHAVLEIGIARMTEIIELMFALGGNRRTTDRPSPPPAFDRDAIVERIAEILQPDAAALRLTPLEVAGLVRTFAFAAAHPVLRHPNPMTADEATRLLLHGVDRRPAPDAIGNDPAADPIQGDSC
ncbi:MAG: TetR/AcrR family transcriptional regulator [Actinomycetota bacterium]|nr:MAG: TetR/AcrR family transcriptional regulator [Actinomycetota bacterium]